MQSLTELDAVARALSGCISHPLLVRFIKDVVMTAGALAAFLAVAEKIEHVARLRRIWARNH
jgi:hypothetical protein